MEIVKPIPIDLDKPRKLKLTLGGMKKFQDVTGKSILKGEVDFHDMSESEVIAFLWACLIWEDRKLTLDDVGFMVDISRLNEIINSLVAAFSISLPAKTDDDSKNAASLQNGSSSGQ